MEKTVIFDDDKYDYEVEIDLIFSKINTNPRDVNFGSDRHFTILGINQTAKQITEYLEPGEIGFKKRIRLNALINTVLDKEDDLIVEYIESMT